MNNTEANKDFLEYLGDWQHHLPVLNLKDILAFPEKTAITAIDLTNGFCKSGALASPRVYGIIEPSIELIKSAWKLGLRDIVLLEDSHTADAAEFSQWPPHCLKGSQESETIDEIKALPFYSQIVQFPKDTIHPALNTGFQGWLDDHSQIETFIVLGDCTDLCTYQLAMHLRLDANANHRKRRVIAPANCIQTYDTPVATAKELGIMAHPGDLIHSLFLYHMALNGIEVVNSLEVE